MKSININNFNKFLETKTKEDNDKLSSDIENVDMEIEGEKVDNNDYEIEEILDVIIPSKEKEREYGNVDESTVSVHSDMTVKEAKRGDIIWVTALLRRRGTTSLTSPAVQGVLKVRIVDIFYGLQYLNKVLNK